MKVKFVECTAAQYAALASKDNGTLYFCVDTQKLYKGEVLFSGTGTVTTQDLVWTVLGNSSTDNTDGEGDSNLDPDASTGNGGNDDNQTTNPDGEGDSNVTPGGSGSDDDDPNA